MITQKEKEFFNFIYERQLVWYKRFVLKQTLPWTDDKILQTFKFINMYRELDRCTLYILKKLKNISNREKLLLNITFFRFFNKDEIYKQLRIPILEKINKKELVKKFEREKLLKKTVFNDAYLISSGNKKEKYLSVIDSLKFLEKNAKEIIQKIDESKQPEESFEALLKIPMIGPFLACEIWTDLSYFNFFKQGWTDNDFVNIGPRAKWGLQILYGEKISKKEQQRKLKHLHNIQKEILEKINSKIPWGKISYKNAFSNKPFLSLTNIEGALCEFRKYWNLSQGKGKRRYFQPLKKSSD